MFSYIYKIIDEKEKLSISLKSRYLYGISALKNRCLLVSWVRN
jgi:hypothetical protein